MGEAVGAPASGARNPVTYAETLCDRIEAVEPDVRAFVQFDRDRVTTTAARVAREHDAWSRPPLYGVPVGVKDIYHVDGFPTRAGSAVPPVALTGPESAAVTALRGAGAYVAGKTVTTEFAHFEPGPTRNPHDLDHTPGGSSSGSAAAVAAGALPLALGSQTIGSVIRPAAFCGIVGFKPSYGRISVNGVVPCAPSVDQMGAFTVDVAGAQLAAGVLCDEWDAVAAEPTGERPTVGVPEGSYLDRASETGQAAFEAAVEALDESLDVRRFELDTTSAYEHHRSLVAAEFALSHEEWFEAYGDRYAEETVKLIESGRDTDVSTLVDARRNREAFRTHVAEWMAEAGVDVLACPAAPGPAPESLDTTGDPVMNLPWTHAGTPVVGLPAGRVDGLPVAVQFVTPYAADEALLAAAPDLAAALPEGELGV
nr:amidase [Haloplanus sp. XH21]